MNRLAPKIITCILLLCFGSTALPKSDTRLVLSQPFMLKWRYKSDQSSHFTPVADSKRVFVPLSGGTLIALNLVDGALLWRTETGGDFSAAPATDDQVVYVATQYAGPENGIVRGTLRALSKETGITLWMRTLQAPLRGSLAAGPGALFAGAANGTVHAFDKRTGLTIWSNQYGDQFNGEPLLSGNRVYIGSVGGWLLALEQSDGRTAWRCRARGPIQGSIAIVDHTVFFGSGDSYVYAFSESRSKLIWKRRTGAAVQAVAAVENGVLASSFDNFAYLLSLRNGAVRWRRLLPGRIPARPLTADDGALFTPLSTDSAIVLSLKDGKPLNTLPLGEENSSNAAPVATGDVVLLTTPHGLLAFTTPQQ